MDKLVPIYSNVTGLVNVYQLDFKIKNCATLIDTIADRKLMETRLNDGWLIDEDVSESIDKIAVSDARNHAERLVFPAFWIKNKETGERKVAWAMDRIDGLITMMIYGGDNSTILEPEAYAHRLRSIQTPRKKPAPNIEIEDEDVIEYNFDNDPTALTRYHMSGDPDRKDGKN